MQASRRAMLDDRRGDKLTAIFDATRRQVVFAPTSEGSVLTDPSYHLPAFTALWAQWDADPAGRAFWRDATQTSRTFFRQAAHPDAGLAADRRSAQAWVERLWDAPVPEGQWRYYHGLLHLFGLLEAGGRFRAFPPAPAT